MGTMRTMAMLLGLVTWTEAFTSQTTVRRDSHFAFGMSLEEEPPLSSPEVAFPRPSSASRIPNNSRRFHTPPQARNEPVQRGNHPLHSLNMNLDSLAKSSQPGSAARAQELLQRIEALHQEGYYAVAPDIVSLNSVLNAWANSSEKDAAEKAMQLLDEELEKMEPNVVSINTIILAFAKRGAAKEADELLHKMEHSYNVTPDTISYNSLLYAYAQANQPEHAERVLKEMMQLSSLFVKPDTITFNTVLLAWAKSGHRKACQRSEELLKHMITLHEAGNDDVAPDVYSYSIVLQALTTSHGATAAARALQLLETMEQNDNLAPNAVTYTTVMTALSKCGYKNAAPEAEKLLNRMIERYNGGDDDCKPDTVAFTAVISCWARGFEHEHADERTLKLLEVMKNGDDDAKPNAMTYTSVLKSLARSRKATACQKAEDLLEEMEQAYQNGNAALQPTSIHYNVAMDVYAMSPNYDKASKAYQLYRQMGQRNHTQPNIVSYNTLLRACANTFGHPAAKETGLSIATEAFSAILNSDKIKASSITLFFFIKAVRKLVKSEKDSMAMIRKSFKYCCKLGLLNDIILEQVKLSCRSETQLAALLEMDAVSRDVSASDLPAEWTCNAQKVRGSRR